MITLLVFAQQGIVLKFTAADATTDHLLLMDMGAFIVYTQLCRIDVVKRAFSALIMPLRVPLAMHRQRFAILKAFHAYFALVERINRMLLLQMQLVFAHATKLQLTKVAVHRLLHLAEALMSLQTALHVEHLVTGGAHKLLFGNFSAAADAAASARLQLLRLLWRVHACVVGARRALILENASAGGTILLHIAIHFCKI